MDIARIEFLSKLRMTGMPIRRMQEYAILLRQKPDAIEERRAILEAHEQVVQQQIQQLTQNLEMIQWKIQNYRKLAEQHHESAQVTA